MCLLYGLFAGCFLVAPLLPAQDRAAAPFEISLTLGAGSQRIELEGKSFALVRNTPHKSIPAFSILTAERNTVSWSIPAEQCDGSYVQWFLVEGMQREEQVAGFYEHPEKWTWALWGRHIRPGSCLLSTPLVEKGWPILAHGRIKTKDGRPLPELFPTLAFLEPRGRFAGMGGTWKVAIDERNGRFWIQAGHEYFGGELALNLSARMLEGNGYARITKHRLDATHETVIELVPEARISGEILGVDKEHWYPLRAELRQGGKTCFERDLGMDPKIDLPGLSAGRYDLRITTNDPTDILFERAGLDTREGKTLRLPEPIDLRQEFSKVRIQVKDAEGHPLVALLESCHRGRGRGSRTCRVTMAGKGVWNCLVRKTGGRFRVQMDGYAPRYLHDVETDQVVTLYRPHELLLEIRGLSKGGGLLSNLFVQAIPEQGFEDWELNALRPRLLPRGISRKMRERMANLPQKTAKTFCFAPVEEAGRARLLLTHPGKWKLRVLYLAQAREVEVPLAQAVEVDMKSRRRAMVLKLDPEIVNRAFDKFWSRPGPRRRK